jgi:hypothetical protein
VQPEPRQRDALLRSAVSIAEPTCSARCESGPLAQTIVRADEPIINVAEHTRTFGEAIILIDECDHVRMHTLLCHPPSSPCRFTHSIQVRD